MRLVRTLLVDDSQLFLEAAVRFLAAHQWLDIVGQATSGDQALAMTEQLAPDLVLIDVNMPGMDGLQATRQIKQRPNPPRVVVMTLHDIPEYREAAHAASADDFIAKSSIATRLIAMIDSLFTVPAPV